MRWQLQRIVKWLHIALRGIFFGFLLQDQFGGLQTRNDSVLIMFELALYNPRLADILTRGLGQLGRLSLMNTKSWLPLYGH